MIDTHGIMEHSNDTILSFSTWPKKHNSNILHWHLLQELTVPNSIWNDAQFLFHPEWIPVRWLLCTLLQKPRNILHSDVRGMLCYPRILNYQLAFILHYWYAVLYSLVESFSVYCCIISVSVCSATWVRLYVGIYWKLWSNNPLLSDWHMASYYGNPELCWSPNSGCQMLNARATSGSNSHTLALKRATSLTLESLALPGIHARSIWLCGPKVHTLLKMKDSDVFVGYLLCLWRLT
jgi:hypothetical protein